MTPADKPRTAASEQTARTDAFTLEHGDCLVGDFARQLERELSTANAGLERLRELALLSLPEDRFRDSPRQAALRAELGEG